jgi:hypothetical protein
MEHADALREMSVEKYLLGELTGSARDSFEEHLFECPLCAADLRTTLVFARAARKDLIEEPQRVFALEKKQQGWFASLFRPQWMAPALAACVLLIGYQAGVRIPALEQQIAESGTPDVVAFSGGATRGGELRHVRAAQHGEFGLSVDLPPQSGYSDYVFSVIAPSGSTVWTRSLPYADAKETQLLTVPAAVTQAGKNILLVQGQRAGSGGTTMDELQRHEFVLDLHP